MRVIVVGAGIWGLPTGAELARRGHTVTVIDRYGIGNEWSSSRGATRIWRLAHETPREVRLALRAVAAWERLEARADRKVLLRRGILWRDNNDAREVADSLASESVPHEVIEAHDVGRVFPGLVADTRAAVWQPEAGPVLAAEALSAAREILLSSGGRLLVGPHVREISETANGVHLSATLPDGTTADYDADVAVVATGPGIVELGPTFGFMIPMRPILEQISYVDGVSAGVDARDLPCLIDITSDHGYPLYAMATPGTGPDSGWKVGVDSPVARPFDLDDREPSREADARVSQWIAGNLPDLDPTINLSQVCSWTMSPDEDFVIERRGSIVVAAGDSGRGFKFGAFMGETLADLAEGSTADDDVAPWSSARLANANC